MKSIFKQIRESAAKVAQAWAEGNRFEVDLDSAKVLLFGEWSGRVDFLAANYSGHPAYFSVSFEPKGDEMHVFADSAPVEKFSMVPYRLDWNARWAYREETDQGLIVSRAIWANAAQGKTL